MIFDFLQNSVSRNIIKLNLQIKPIIQIVFKMTYQKGLCVQYIF